MEQNYKEFLYLNLLENKKYAEIESKLNVERKQLRKWMKEAENAKYLLNLIRQSNKLYHSKKQKTGFLDSFPNKTSFYNWYSNQEKRCYYCKIEEEKLKEIFDFDKGTLYTKRGRGRSLELERINTENHKNIYSKENCTLACYLCNNHKSDLISAADHKKYFALKIKEYLEDKYKELKS